MTIIGNRFWVDWIYKCSYDGKGNNPCVSDCSDFESLGNLIHTGNNQTGAGYSNVSSVIFNTIDTVYNFSNWGNTPNYKNNSYLWGLFFESNQVDGSQSNYIGNSNYAFPVGTRYVNVYFNGVSKGISFDLSSAYQSSSYAMIKANHLIDMSLVTSIDVSCSSVPLYMLNTDVCGDESSCLGVNVCANKNQLPICNCVVYGKDWVNNDIQESFVLDFTNGDVVINLHQIFASITSVSLSVPSNSFMGNGVISCFGAYTQWLSAMWNYFSAIKNCATFDYLGCVMDFYSAIQQGYPVLNTNVGTFTFDICEEYASFNPDLNFFHTSADIIEGGLCQFQNFLWPQLKFTLSAGFEPIITSEECCCDDYDTTVKRGGNGSITITTTTGPEDDDGDDNECICYWLQEINDTLESKMSTIINKLDGLISAINGLDLICNTTVQPCTPSVTVTNPVNNITVEPCTPSVTVTNPVNNITVEPCSPSVVVNPTDLSGLISSLQTSLASLNTSLSANTDALVCADSQGAEKGIACILKESLNDRDGKGLADVINDKETSPYVDVAIEPYDLVNIRRAFKDDDIQEG